MTFSISDSVSALALIVSISTAWLTLVYRGKVKMTRPTQFFFGTDDSRWGDHPASTKIYLRALLFATSKRGRVIENMYVTVTHGGTHQGFNIWAYGEREKLVRGSGLFVPETGVEANHHFLISPGTGTFEFTPGSYKLEVFAHILGEKQRRLMISEVLEVTPTIAQEMRESDAGIYFDWIPDSLRYVSHVERRPLHL